tara:strand:+ start:89 stop:679 length:591 start_codon:yes stop_codon:yes gene_type:complete
MKRISIILVAFTIATLSSCTSPQTSKDYENEMNRLYDDFKTTSLEVLFEVNALDYINYEINFEQGHLDGTKRYISEGEKFVFYPGEKIPLEEELAGRSNNLSLYDSIKKVTKENEKMYYLVHKFNGNGLSYIEGIVKFKNKLYLDKFKRSKPRYEMTNTKNVESIYESENYNNKRKVDFLHWFINKKDFIGPKAFR